MRLVCVDVQIWMWRWRGHRSLVEWQWGCEVASDKFNNRYGVHCLMRNKVHRTCIVYRWCTCMNGMLLMCRREYIVFNVYVVYPCMRFIVDRNVVDVVDVVGYVHGVWLIPIDVLKLEPTLSPARAPNSGMYTPVAPSVPNLEFQNSYFSFLRNFCFRTLNVSFPLQYDACFLN